MSHMSTLPKSNLKFNSLYLTPDQAIKSKYSQFKIKPSFLSYGSSIKKWTGISLMSNVMANCIRRSNVLNQYNPTINNLFTSDGL